jgi:hypothetical protein
MKVGFFGIEPLCSQVVSEEARHNGITSLASPAKSQVDVAAARPLLFCVAARQDGRRRGETVTISDLVLRKS